jgi:uncharacterized protein YndB with AHSA1/START domain
MPERSNANEIRITRIYDASVETVWDAWIDPDQVVQWWGPRGFTTTTYSKDVRPGGSWVYNMRGPDGTDYPNRANYLEVEKYTKLVYDHGASDDRPPLFRVTVLFIDLKGKTKEVIPLGTDFPNTWRKSPPAKKNSLLPEALMRLRI